MDHFKEFSDQFKKMSDSELIDAFNGDVRNPGWVAARGDYHRALHQEFEARSFDYSIIGDKNRMSLKKRIKLVGEKIQINE